MKTKIYQSENILIQPEIFKQYNHRTHRKLRVHLHNKVTDYKTQENRKFNYQ